jgi:hypothetical protein
MKNNNDMKDLIEGLNNYLNEATTPPSAALIQTFSNLIKKDYLVVSSSFKTLESLVTREKMMELLKAMDIHSPTTTLPDALDHVVSFIEDIESDLSKIKNSIANIQGITKDFGEEFLKNTAGAAHGMNPSSKTADKK